MTYKMIPAWSQLVSSFQFLFTVSGFHDNSVLKLAMMFLKLKFLKVKFLFAATTTPTAATTTITTTSTPVVLVLVQVLLLLLLLIVIVLAVSSHNYAGITLICLFQHFNHTEFVLHSQCC